MGDEIVHPLVRIGYTTVPTYQVCLAVAFLVGTILLIDANRRSVSPLRIGPFMIVPLYLASLLGARLMSTLMPQTAPVDSTALALWKGGYWYHGGLIGGIAAYALYHAMRKNSILDASDLVVPFVCLGEGITRIGCFLSGCCWGKPVTTLPGVVYPRASHVWAQQLHDGLITESAAKALPVHAVQLYMSILMLILFVLLRLVSARRIVAGEITLLFLVAHCFVRFWIECLRADIDKAALGLSATQWTCAVVYVAALSPLMYVYGRKRAEIRVVAYGKAAPA